MSNPVYFKCPECNSLKYKKWGKPKDKVYQCTECGTLRNRGRRIKK